MSTTALGEIQSLRRLLQEHYHATTNGDMSGWRMHQFDKYEARSAVEIKQDMLKKIGVLREIVNQDVGQSQPFFAKYTEEKNRRNATDDCFQSVQRILTANVPPNSDRIVQAVSPLYLTAQLKRMAQENALEFTEERLDGGMFRYFVAPTEELTGSDEYTFAMEVTTHPTLVVSSVSLSYLMNEDSWELEGDSPAGLQIKNLLLAGRFDRVCEKLLRLASFFKCVVTEHKRGVLKPEGLEQDVARKWTLFASNKENECNSVQLCEGHNVTYYSHPLRTLKPRYALGGVPVKCALSFVTIEVADVPRFVYELEPPLLLASGGAEALHALASSGSVVTGTKESMCAFEDSYVEALWRKPPLCITSTPSSKKSVVTRQMHVFGTEITIEATAGDNHKRYPRAILVSTVRVTASLLLDEAQGAFYPRFLSFLRQQLLLSNLYQSGLHGVDLRDEAALVTTKATPDSPRLRFSLDISPHPIATLTLQTRDENKSLLQRLVVHVTDDARPIVTEATVGTQNMKSVADYGTIIIQRTHSLPLLLHYVTARVAAMN